VLVLRALALESAQVEVEAAPPIAVDRGGAVERMQGGLRLRTISRAQGVDAPVFAALRAYLAIQYPAVHRTLELEPVSQHTLLFRWPGSRPERSAVVLLAHQDVVPVDEGTEGAWSYPPWEGAVAEGYLWGRGAIDDKLSLFGILEAVESLIDAGFAPTRPLYLSFGHDEEIGGGEGAQQVAALLAERGVDVGLVLDEGGAVVEGVLPGFDRPIAFLGIAEKGYLSVVLEVDDAGGHSSMPRAEGAIGILARAVAKLQDDPMPAHFSPASRAFVERGIGPELDLPMRIVAANLWLFAGPISWAATASPSMAALLRTTPAPTVFRAGVRDNVLPAHARAIVNFRILTGDSVEGVLEHVRRTIDDDRVHISTTGDEKEPSPASSIEHPGYAVVARTIRQVYPDAVVAPFLVLGGTDARHFTGLCACVYRFAPIQGTTADVGRAHGTDERVSLDSIGNAVRFYRRLIENAQAGG
jgi:carboxypeptidase PM20D1